MPVSPSDFAMRSWPLARKPLGSGKFGSPWERSTRTASRRCWDLLPLRRIHDLNAAWEQLLAGVLSRLELGTESLDLAGVKGSHCWWGRGSLGRHWAA